jgi:hypothetical protein
MRSGDLPHEYHGYEQKSLLWCCVCACACVPCAGSTVVTNPLYLSPPLPVPLQGVQFYTQIKTITSNWDYKPAAAKLSMSMPTLGNTR